MTNKAKILTAFLVLLYACSIDESLPSEVYAYEFVDGFEVANHNLSQLFPLDGSRWSNLQQVGDDNQIELSKSTFSEGKSSLRLVARASEDFLSKMGIEKSGFKAYKDDIVRIKADLLIASNSDIENLLLIDLECCSCWDSSVPDNQCPGIRLMVKQNDFLAIERGKILGTTLLNSTVPFPRNQWFSLVWESKLSDTDEGLNNLTINGKSAITTKGMNMPNSDLFSDAFAKQGTNFELQLPLYYERVQIGITANPTPNDVEVFIDNFQMTIVN